MAVQNSWLSPLQRSYGEIKSRILDKLKTNNPEITDLSEGNIFIIIISIFSAIAEVLHYYIDNMARETFFVTARRFDSLYKHCKLVDYHIKAGIPASMDIWAQVEDGSSIPENGITIYKGTTIKANNGSTWQVAEDTYWGFNIGDKVNDSENSKVDTRTYIHKVPLTQITGTHTVISNSNPVTYNTPGQYISISNIPEDQRYLEGSMIVVVEGVTWELVDTFAYSKPNSKHFKVSATQDGGWVIEFGNGQYGAIPRIGSTITATCLLTLGAAGNGLTANDFSDISSLIPDVEGQEKPKLTIAAALTSSGGSDYEGFDQIQEHLPLAVRTLGIAVTKEDYEDIAKLIPGINKSYVKYNCGKNIIVYVTPDGVGTQASKALIENASKYFGKVKSITSAISVIAAPMAHIILDVTITGKKSFKAIDIEQQVKKALIDTYSYYNSDVNKPVRLSDIYSLIDNLSLVDYLTINFLWLYTDPQIYVNADGYDIPLVLNNVKINWKDPEDNIYKLVIDKTTKNPTYKLYKRVLDPEFNEDYGTDMHSWPEVTGADISVSNTISIKSPVFDLSAVLDNAPGDNANYTLYIHRPNTDQQPDDYGMPLLRESDLTLTINETI